MEKKRLNLTGAYDKQSLKSASLALVDMGYEDAESGNKPKTTDQIIHELIGSHHHYQRTYIMAAYKMGYNGRMLDGQKAVV